MRGNILAEQYQNSRDDHYGQWLTTADVARALAVTVDGVQWLARSGRIFFERTRSGQRLFRQGDVMRLVEHRAKRRLAGPTIGRASTGPIGEPRQLSLFGKARLKLVPTTDGGETVLRDPVAKEPDFGKKFSRV